MKLTLVIFSVFVTSQLLASSIQITNDLTFYPRQGQSLNQRLRTNPLSLNLFYTFDGFFQTLTGSDSFNPLKETSLGVYIDITENIFVDNKNLEKIVIKSGTYEVNCGQVFVEFELGKENFKTAYQEFTLTDLDARALTPRGKLFKNEGIQISFSASAPRLPKNEASCAGIIKRVLSKLPGYVISDNMTFIE